MCLQKRLCGPNLSQLSNSCRMNELMTMNENKKLYWCLVSVYTKNTDQLKLMEDVHSAKKLKMQDHIAQKSGGQCFLSSFFFFTLDFVEQINAESKKKQRFLACCLYSTTFTCWSQQKTNE